MGGSHQASDGHDGRRRRDKSWHSDLGWRLQDVAVLARVPLRGRWSAALVPRSGRSLSSPFRLSNAIEDEIVTIRNAD